MNFFFLSIFDLRVSAKPSENLLFDPEESTLALAPPPPPMPSMIGGDGSCAAAAATAPQGDGRHQAKAVMSNLWMLGCRK